MTPPPTEPVIVETSSVLVDWLTLGVVLVAGLIAIFELDQARRGRHAQVMAEMFRRRDEPRLLRIRRVLYGKTSEQIKARMGQLIRSDYGQFLELMAIPDFFEDLGTLVKHRAVSRKLANALLGGAIVWQWTIWEPWIQELRERRKKEVKGSESLYANWEWLAGRIATKYRRRVSSPA